MSVPTPASEQKTSWQQIADFLVRRRTLFAWAGPLPLVLVARFDPLWFILGALLVALGEGLRVWSAGLIVKNERLATTGPYALARNPLYLGSLLILIGYCFLSGRWLSFVVMLALFAAFYWPTILREEAFLESRFGEEYRAYRKRTPVLLPFGHPLPENSPAFSWFQVKKNREYTGVLGALGMIALFALREVLWH